MNTRLGMMVVLLAGVLALSSWPAVASEEIAANEGGLDCAVCHVDVESDQLTDKGRYYQMLSTLEG